VELVAPSPMVQFVTKTDERIEGYLGNLGRTDTLPYGVSLNKQALQKTPWCFGKTLYLNAHSFMADSLSHEHFNHMLGIDQVLVVRGIICEDNYYGYLVVEPSKDPKYRWQPVFVTTKARKCEERHK